MAFKTATNPETGERVALVDNEWVPFSKTATNQETNERVALINNKWESIGMPKPVATPAAPTIAAAPAIAAAQQEAPVTAEEEAAAARPAFGNPQIVRQGIARKLNAQVAPPAIPQTAPQQPATPYKDRREALDDAVNFLEENQDFNLVAEKFASIGITPDQIAAHGKARNSPYFAQQAAPDTNVSNLPYLGQTTLSSSDIKPEDQSIGREAADYPLNLTQGAVAGIRMIAEAIPANQAGTAVSNNLRSVEKYLGSLMSAQARQDSEEISRIMKAAENQGVADQVRSGIQALSVAPVKTLINALGTSAPLILGGLAAYMASAPAAVVTGIGLGVGALSGAGTVKGTIYEDTKQALIDAGVNKYEAEERAKLAQQYNGKNLDQILLGTAIGAGANITGMQPALAKALAAKILNKVAAAETTQASKAIESAAAEITKRSYGQISAELAKAGLIEGTPEFVQAFQEKVASNIAKQREGFDVKTYSGAVAAGTLEGLAGWGLGAGAKGLEVRSDIKEANLTPSERVAKELARGVSLTNFSKEGQEREALDRLRTSPRGYPFSVPNINLPVIPEGAAEASRGLFRTGSPLENPDPTKFDPDYDAAGKLTGWKIKAVAVKPAVLPTAEPKVTPEAPAEEEAGAPGMVGEEDVDQGVTPESTITPVIVEKEPVTDTGLDLPIVYPLVGNLKLSDDVPQFKSGTNEKGVVEPLGGTFDATGVAPIQVWRRLNGDLEVISGRHRLDLARRSGKVTIPAQIHNEADGFDKQKASILDAELNIRDGQGKVRDYVDYFQGSKISREEADTRGLLARAIGKRSYAIATDGSPTLVAALRGDVVGDEAAYLIAKNYPQDEKLQSVAVKAIQDGKSIAAAINLTHAVKILAAESNATPDMFGQDDSGMREAEEMQKVAGKKQREVAQRLSAITGASKNPSLAKAEGIDIKDPEAVKRRIEELRQLKASWENWPTSPKLIAEIRAEIGVKKPDLVLKGETEEEIRKREAAAPEEQRKADEKKIADQEVDMFGLQQQVQDRVTPEIEDIFGGDEDVSTEYKIALEKLRIAYKDFSRADLAYRAQEINDEEFLAARKRFDEIDAEYDKALEKENNRKKEKPKVTQEKKPPKEKYTKEQRDAALEHVKDTGGELVWQDGEYALIRGYGVLAGDPVYIPTVGSNRGKVDISAFTGKQIPDAIKAEMLKQKERLEKEAESKHEDKPFITFSDGVALSRDIPFKIAGVIREWKNLLNLQPNIYVSTVDDASANKLNFTGPHRRIGSGTLDANERGSMRRMADGSYYILFSKSTSITKMLETIAHEFGHVHERLVFENATKEEKEALQKEHRKWLDTQKGKTAQDLIIALRAKTTGKTTAGPAGLAADSLTPYWKSFGEWYADQTARWAMSTAEPISIVEKYFRRLGAALRKFYQSLKGQNYLPSETFKNYIEAATKRPASLDPRGDEANLMQNGFNFDDDPNSEDQNEMVESSASKKALPSTDAMDAVISKALHEADQLPGAKKKLPPGRSPELATAAQMVKAGTMTAAEFDKLVNKYKPIYLYAESLVPATTEKMVDALDSAKRDKVNPAIPAGTQVGLRLDIPAFNRKGVYVVSIHAKGTKSGPGKSIGYTNVAKVTNATFGLGGERAALNIAAGAGKDALQTIEGSYVPITAEQAYSQAKTLLSDPSWTQIGVDPTRHSYFYDRRTTVPVVAAEEVLQIGNMVLGKNVTYGKKEAFLYNIDTTPKETSEQKKEQALKTRKDKIEEYAKMRQKQTYLVEKIRNYGSSIATQRLLNDLKKEADELKNEIDLTKGKGVVTPENFLNQARRAMDGEMPFKGQSLSPEVFAVIQAAYQKTPWLLSGLKLSIRTKAENAQDKSSANFAPLSRIVTLWNGTSGTEDPTSVRHELAHSMEQMMTPEQRTVVVDAWFKSLDKAIKNNKDELAQKYFEKVLAYLGNPNERTLSEATNAMPSYEFYQYLSPSEFWAVNAEKLLAQQLGGTWAKFKKAMLALFEGLKNILGFDNRYAVHKVFNNIVNGEHKRMSRTMLDDFVRASGNDFEFLNNIQDDIDLVKKWNRPNTPSISMSPVKDAIIKIGKSSKDIFIEAATHPINTANKMVNGIDRGVTFMRNKNVWFGTGLNLADQTRYGGLIRTSQGFATASIALDNALRAGMIGTEVIFQGGIKYNPKTMNYAATKRQKGMVGVYKAEGELRKRIGAQLGTDIIQGYLEAKRSRSIQNELIDRDAEVDRLKDELDYLNSQPIIDPKAIKITTDSLKEAQSSLTAVKKAEQKVNMSEDEIDEFIARESEHPELRDIMDNWNAVNQDMLKFWLNVGLLSQGRYDILSNIKDYVPWYRIMEDDVSSDSKSTLLSSTRSMTNIGREKLFKPGKPIVVTNFIAEDGQQTFKIQPSTVVQVEINDQVINPSNVKTSPNGEVKINVPITEGDLVVFTTNREIENIIDNMTRNVMRMTMNGLRQHAAQRAVLEYATRTKSKNGKRGKIKVFAKEDRDKGIFSFISNGKNIIVEIEDTLIAEAVLGMEHLDTGMLKLFGFIPLVGMANFTRRAITLSGVFQLKQVFKDAPTAALVTGVKHPYILLGGVFKGFLTALNRPFINAIGKRIAGPGFDLEPVVAILKSHGVGGYLSPSRTPEAAIKQELGIRNRNIGSFVLRALDHIGDSSDVAQRIAVYKRVLAETGDEALALYKAANVINFLHHGSGQTAQAIVKTVTFMGAYANSMDVLATALAGGGLKGVGRAKAFALFAATASMLTTFTLLYCMLVGADDEYNEMDDQAKIRNYMIPGTKIVLPMNTSPSLFFKALPELIYNYVMKHGTKSQVDERRLREAMKQAALDLLLGPEPIPTGIRPWVEIGIKHDFFTGRSITPRGMENIDAAEQYTETTSELGKWLSSKTGTERTRALTPIETDHLIKGIFGTAGAVAMWASNLIGEPATIRPEMTAKQTPLIGPFLRDDIGRNREDLFYDLESVVNQRWETLKAKEGREKDTEKFDAENEDLLDMHKAVAKIKSKLNAINKDIRTAGQTTEKDLTPKERRKEITELKQEKNDVLDDVIEMRNELNLQ